MVQNVTSNSDVLYSLLLINPQIRNLREVSQIQDFGDLQDLRDLQGDVIYTSIFTLLIYYTYFISTRNTISHHISAKDGVSLPHLLPSVRRCECVFISLTLNEKMRVYVYSPSPSMRRCVCVSVHPHPQEIPHLL